MDRALKEEMEPGEIYREEDTKFNMHGKEKIEGMLLMAIMDHASQLRKDFVEVVITNKEDGTSTTM